MEKLTIDYLRKNNLIAYEYVRGSFGVTPKVFTKRLDIDFYYSF